VKLSLTLFLSFFFPQLKILRQIFYLTKTRSFFCLFGGLGGAELKAAVLACLNRSALKRVCRPPQRHAFTLISHGVAWDRSFTKLKMLVEEQ
jgi:hypothetical protein